MFPQAGPNRFKIACFLWLVVSPAHFLVRWATRVPNPTGWLDLLAMSAALVSAAIEPTLWPAALLFQMMNLGGVVAFLGPAWTWSLGGGSIMAMTIVALARPVDGALQMIVVASVIAPVLLAGASRKVAVRRRASQRIEAAVRSLPMIVWEADATGEATLGLVGRTETLLGRDHAEVLRRGLVADVHPDDRAAYLARFDAVDALTDLAFRYCRPDGSQVWLSERVAWGDGGDGRVARGVAIDITQARRNEIGLRRHEQIVRRMASMTVVVEPQDDALRIADVSDPIGWGVPASAIGGDFSHELPSLASRSELLEVLGKANTLTHLGPWDVADSTGARRTVEVETFPIPGDAAALIVSDVSEREHMLALVRHRAHHDDLTGLANRASLLEAAEVAIGRGCPVSLLLVDLNEFKAVNDTLGHLSGDGYLAVLAKRFAGLVEGNDVVARLGGDEFALLLVGASSQRTDAVVAAVEAASREPVRLHGVAIAGSASVGIACGPLDGTDAESLLRCADIAMYHAKRAHQGSCRYEAALDHTDDQLLLLSEIGVGFERGQIEMHFQPKVDVRTRAVVGLEALARWNHPERGVLPATAFIELVTLAGMTDRLVETALGQAVAALRSLPAPLHVAVNLTALDIRSPCLPALCRKVLHEVGVDPARLTLEITESHVLDTSGVIRHVVEELAAMGVRMAVDDFGTGFSSLVHLRALPLSEIKIDRSFVRAIDTDSHDLVIVRSIIDLAHELGLTVTAEGVETEMVAERLIDLRCDQAQGFLYGRPAPLRS